MTQDIPKDDDLELDADVEDEPDDDETWKRKQDFDLEGVAPKRIRLRYYRSPEYWDNRSKGMPPLKMLQEGPMPRMASLHHDPPEPQHEDEPPMKRAARETLDSIPEEDYTPSVAPPGESPDVAPAPDIEVVPDSVSEHANDPEASSTKVEPTEAPMDVEERLQRAVEHPVPEDEDLLVTARKQREEVFELSFDIYPEDIRDNPFFLWGIVDECYEVNTAQAKKRNVEVSFRKLNDHDNKKLFEAAMQKEWQSWIDNKVTSICSSRGISRDRIIRARWVLVWKKSSDPDDRSKTPKARLVLVGWELGQIATDSP